jgi:hypothetical protein
MTDEQSRETEDEQREVEAPSEVAHVRPEDGQAQEESEVEGHASRFGPGMAAGPGKAGGPEKAG